MPNRLPSILFLALSIGTMTLPIGGAASAQVAPDAPKNVLEFYKLLPDKYFEVDREQRATVLLDPKRGSIVDISNGYLYAQGDGAQGSLWVCVFKRPDRSYLVVVKSHPGDTDALTNLDFFEFRENRLQTVQPKAVLPVAINSRLTYQMPRQGRTIRVLAPDGTRIYDLTWTGTKFEKRQPEK